MEDTGAEEEAEITYSELYPDVVKYANNWVSADGAFLIEAYEMDDHFEIGVVQVTMIRLELYRQTGSLPDLLDWKKVLLFAAMFFGIRKFKKHPVIYIAISAVIGILFAF